MIELLLSLMDIIYEVVLEILDFFREIVIKLVYVVVGWALILSIPVWIIPYGIYKANKKHNKNYNKNE